jgi:hypothetical protein
MRAIDRMVKSRHCVESTVVAVPAASGIHPRPQFLRLCAQPALRCKRSTIFHAGQSTCASPRTSNEPQLQSCRSSVLLALRRTKPRDSTVPFQSLELLRCSLFACRNQDMEESCTCPPTPKQATDPFLCRACISPCALACASSLKGCQMAPVRHTLSRRGPASIEHATCSSASRLERQKQTLSVRYISPSTALSLILRWPTM